MLDVCIAFLVVVCVIIVTQRQISTSENYYMIYLYLFHLTVDFMFSVFSFKQII